MLIKIKNKIYSSKQTPITVVLQDGDLEDMKISKDNEYRICFYSGNLDKDTLEEAMTFESDPKHQA